MKGVFLICILAMLWQVQSNSLRKLDPTCSICQSQCSDLNQELDDFYAKKGSQWDYLVSLACGIDDKIQAAEQAINITQLYMQAAKRYSNQPTLHQIAKILLPGLITIGTRYSDFKKEIIQLASLLNKADICSKASDFANITGTIIGFFMGYIIQDSSKSIEIQSQCGFDPCVAIATTSQELKNSHIPNVTFTNNTQIASAQQTTYLLTRDLEYYSVFYNQLIAPLNAILDKKYTACNGAKCQTATGFAIIVANSTAMNNQFPNVAQNVSALISNNIWTSLYFTRTANGGVKGFEFPAWNIPKQGITYPNLKLTYGQEMKYCLDKIGGFSY